MGSEMRLGMYSGRRRRRGGEGSEREQERRRDWLRRETEERWWEGGKRNERGGGFEEEEGREGVGIVVVGDESIGFLRIEDAIVERRVVNLNGDDDREEGSTWRR